ncbi:1,2-dihydroxy-3-keto-5-methylthiopentene dioxygenase [Cimex lectularius]|uniref:Acireductone dioxygenase n=1 Tax=Cimex lectularius TaxID=79782 RepID=A0A8I6RCU1_CIMLE|nr:1,2-dihydroxy-3-keto-5-methylthiopentene dioxygenase [Cimex lectularius]
MVCCWYMDDKEGDQRDKHMRDENSFVTLDRLKKLTGVEYIHIEDLDDKDSIENIKRERGYNYEDEMTCSKECLENYEERLKTFYTEHLHTDEEIRLVLDGTGYFDVRDKEDNWIRIKVVQGDLLIIPSGIYHRFTLDQSNFIKAKRFFQGEPVWTPHNRPAEDMQCRKDYLAKLTRGF